jgi:hypothetical protein
MPQNRENENKGQEYSHHGRQIITVFKYDLQTDNRRFNHQVPQKPEKAERSQQAFSRRHCSG